MWDVLALGRLSGSALTRWPRAAGRLWARRTGTVALASLLAVCCGCPFATGPDPNDDGDLPFLDENGNFTFDGATALPLNPDDDLRFSGAIGSTADLDMYDLGTLAPGDRLFVDVEQTGGNLDAVAAIFDEDQNIHAYNDDRAEDGSNLDPQIDVVVRGPESTYYLGIAALYGTGTSGAYKVAVRITRDEGQAAPAAQTVFLDWNGGVNLAVENVGVFNLTPFDAADVGLASSQTGALKDGVQTIVAERYAAYELVLLNSDDHAEPSGPHSTVFFGSDNRRAFAIAAHIDTMNADESDNAIVFTRAFDDAFSRTPTLDEMAQALGNTVAHEVGHLLGLVHTADCNCLMDSTCGNDRILRSQAFKRSPLDDSVFPLGYQDATELLGWILGLVGL